MLSSYLPNSKESDRDMEEVEFRRYIILTGDLAEIRWIATLHHDELRHDVISTVLCNISISYSSIWLADLAKKLRLNSASPVADAESIVAKTIYDGAIDASLDHANGWMVSKETGDIYSTNEPQLAFNSRIALSPNMHNEAVQALHFPPNTSKEKESAEKRRERQQQEQKLAKTSNYDLLFILSYQLLAASLYFPLLLIFFYWNHYHFFFEA